MSTIKDFLEADHVRCDRLFACVGEAVERGDWSWAGVAMEAFGAALSHHLCIEEELLFPALEKANPNLAGPTTVMRTEHAHLRSITDAAIAALQAHDKDGFMAAADTMQIMNGQHNLKEESMLYPTADTVLASGAAAMVQSMQSMAVADGA